MWSLQTWFRLLRVQQWSKNAVVFAALVFGDPDVDGSILRSVAAFIAFCAVSSAGYIINDLQDIERDRIHPSKKKRPIAAGIVSAHSARRLAIALVIGGLLISLAVQALLALVVLTYFLLTTAYSLKLKNVVLLDAFVIAVGFLLRAVGGAAAVEVPVSPWLMLCTLLLALFLAFGKRRSELTKLGENASSHRIALEGYSVPFLDSLLVITAGCTIMAYAFYSFTSESVPGSGIMMLTVPFVMFAIFRYLLLIFKRGEGSTPETLLWKDTPLLASVVGWGIAVLAILAFV